MFGKGSVRSESPSCALAGDGGRHDGEQGSPPGTLVKGPNLPKRDEGDKEKESVRTYATQPGRAQGPGGDIY